MSCCCGLTPKSRFVYWIDGCWLHHSPIFVFAHSSHVGSRRAGLHNSAVFPTANPVARNQSRRHVCSFSFCLPTIPFLLCCFCLAETGTTNTPPPSISATAGAAAAVAAASTSTASHEVVVSSSSSFSATLSLSLPEFPPTVMPDASSTESKCREETAAASSTTSVGDDDDVVVLKATPPASPSPTSATASLPIQSPEASQHDSAVDDANDERCVICLTDFVEGEMVRLLPCLHRFHVEVWAVLPNY